MTRDEAIKKFQGDCNCIGQKEVEDEASFSDQGCDVCNKVAGRILGADVYQVEGYNPKTKEIEDLGQVCGECLCYIANGE